MLEIVTDENVVPFSRDQGFEISTHIFLTYRDLFTKEESSSTPITIEGGASDEAERRDCTSR